MVVGIRLLLQRAMILILTETNDIDACADCSYKNTALVAPCVLSAWSRVLCLTGMFCVS